jgi:hypothetical protein
VWLPAKWLQSGTDGDGSRPKPSSIATTPISVTRLQRMPVGETSALPEPAHSAAATATAMTPLSSVLVMTPGFSVRPLDGGRRETHRALLDQQRCLLPATPVTHSATRRCDRQSQAVQEHS